MGWRRSIPAAVLGGLAVAALARPVAAHVGSLTETSVSAPVPTWLTVITGGAVVGASFLITSVVTDRGAIRRLNGLALSLPSDDGLHRAARILGSAVGLVALGLVVVAGLVGPADGQSNAAILLVWAGWWAGFTMTVYLAGNAWPLLDPFRAIARLLPTEDGRWDLPERWGAWPSVAGLLALVWLEVVSPVASDPRLLAGLVVGYAVAAALGSLAVGRHAWFGTVDPVARVFRCYGAIAPLQWRDGRLSLHPPGLAPAGPNGGDDGAFAGDDGASADDHGASVDDHGVSVDDDATAGEPRAAALVAERGGPAFVVALLWVTTYDGLVATPAWEALATPIVDVGVPPLLLYAVAIVVGFAAFLGIYRVAARGARRTADTFVAGDDLERRFAPALLPIAAGYHLAHFLGYFVALSPLLLATLGNPLGAPDVITVAILPDWWGTLQLGFVLLGHVLGVWVAHALAFELLPGTLTPLRSQYPLIVAMIAFTLTSAWIVTQPFGSPPFV